MQRRPPSYAWDWLQRSRPVLAEVADRLTGGPPTSGFVEELRRRFEEDDFTRDVVIGAVADVAFSGRVPDRRPAGSSWDRGLIWWAATLAGTTPTEFENRRAVPVEQRPLFDGPAEADERPSLDDRARQESVARLVARSPERAALAARLRDLLAQSEGDQVPAAAVRDLLRELE